MADISAKRIITEGTAAARPHFACPSRRRKKNALQALLAQAAALSADYAAAMPKNGFFSDNTLSGQRLKHKRGHGENFWQFRPYQAGEASASVDWRRSAREDRLYIREKEHETAQNFVLIPDLSASMLYQSAAGLCSKEERALLWLFILSDFFAKKGEQIAVPHLLPPSARRNAAAIIAAALAADENYPQKSGILADYTAVKRFSHVIIISDFLDKTEDWNRIFTLLAEKQTYIDLIAIADPAEENFPFRGNTLFFDPENRRELYFGQAQKAAQIYKQVYQKHRLDLRKNIASAGGTLFFDNTELPLQRQISRQAWLLQNFYA